MAVVAGAVVAAAAAVAGVLVAVGVAWGKGPSPALPLTQHRVRHQQQRTVLQLHREHLALRLQVAQATGRAMSD